MTSSNKINKFLILPLLASMFFCINSAAAIRYTINPDTPQYLLKGTVEESSDFNWNIKPGQSATDTLTIVNNSDEETLKYSLSAVDTEINAQQVIVFNQHDDDTPNVNTWVTFDNTQITVEPNSQISIPFQMKIPEGAFPGTYYGGISILKQKSASTSMPTGAYGGSAQTRNVLKLTINIPGELNKEFDVSNFYFDQKTNKFFIDIANKGNVLIAFEGTIEQKVNNIVSENTNTIIIPQFETLPNNAISKGITASDPPIFGTVASELKGSISYFNGITNDYEQIDTVNLSVTTTHFSWPIVIIALSTLFLLLLVLIISAWKKSKYKKECTEYIVQENDTLVSIAEKYGMNWKKMAKLNKINPPYSLTPNQKILVHDNTQK